MTISIGYLREYFKNRWPDFGPTEILGPSQLDLCIEKGVFPYSMKALDKLQAFRKYIDAPLRVNIPQAGLNGRGARSPKQNYDIQKVSRPYGNGWEYSFHLWCAFDIDCPNLSCNELYTKAVDSNLWGGIGLYDSWVHVDDRDNINVSPIVWDLRKEK